MVIMKVSKLVLSLRNKMGISQRELAKQLKIAQSALGYVERGVRTPSKDVARRLSDYFNVPVGAFIDGNYNASGIEIKKPIVQIPYYNSIAKAGIGFYNSDEYVNQFVSITEGRVLDALRGVRSPVMLAIEGDSMVPTLADRNIVIVAPGDAEIRDGKIYVFSINEFTYIKRLFVNPLTRKITCKSDNPVYPPFDAEPNEITIHGRVISHLFLDL